MNPLVLFGYLPILNACTVGVFKTNVFSQGILIQVLWSTKGNDQIVSKPSGRKSRWAGGCHPIRQGPQISSQPAVLQWKLVIENGELT